MFKKYKIAKSSKNFHFLVKVITMASVMIRLQLPTSAISDRYFCKDGKPPLTIARTSKGNEIKLILWQSKYFSDSPKQRCGGTSRKLQTYYENGWLQYVRTDVVNKLGVIYVAHVKYGECAKTDIIVVLPPGINRIDALNNLLDMRRIVDGHPLYLTDGIVAYKKGEAYVNIDVLLSRLDKLS